MFDFYLHNSVAKIVALITKHAIKYLSLVWLAVPLGFRRPVGSSSEFSLDCINCNEQSDTNQ